ncbi:MAG: hypothetical protein HQL41_04560 [Alphaproteobacteria bacterium]|nr:hypothetical protein [Alphaproteobacteria bacterium]
MNRIPTLAAAALVLTFGIAKADMRHTDRVVVVEEGAGQVSVLDGTTLERLDRFAARPGQLPPAFSPDGRHVFLCSRDGWALKYDLADLRSGPERRVGDETRAIALSGDGRVLMAGNARPHTLAVLDAGDLAPLDVIPVVDRDGRTSRVASVLAAPLRKAFVATLADLPHVWEIPWDGRPIFPGMIHTYEAGLMEAVPAAGRFPARRMEVPRPVGRAFFADPDRLAMIGAGVFDLDVGRVIASPALPPPASAVVLAGRAFVAHTGEARVSVLDPSGWRVVGGFASPAADAWLSDDGARLWVAGGESILVIDPTTLQAAHPPIAIRATGPVAFTRDGRHVLIPTRDSVIALESATLAEVRRLPMDGPTAIHGVGRGLGKRPSGV